MNIVYTFHAAEQIYERKILRVWVEEAIMWPDFTRRQNNKYLVTRKLNGRSIEVVYIKEKYIKILTVYWI